jgi:hypothetical protein
MDSDFLRVLRKNVTGEGRSRAAAVRLKSYRLSSLHLSIVFAGVILNSRERLKSFSSVCSFSGAGET